MEIKDYQETKFEEIKGLGRTSIPNGTIFFGDSLVQYWDLNKLGMDNVYNCGLEGATTNQLLSLHEDCIAPFKANKVVILCGTNDLDDEYQFDKLDIAFNLFKLIEIINLKYQIQNIYVISPLPIDDNKQKTICRSSMQLKLLGEEYLNITNEFNNVTYLDYYNEFIKDNNLNEEYSDDGIHLNEIGYNKLNNLIIKDIR